MKPLGSLDNYISTYRRESGLSQDDLAIMLGFGGRSSVSRLEAARFIPELERFLALELIFDESIQEMFAGIAERVRESVASRARAVVQGMGEKPTPENVQKLTTLARLVHVDEDNAMPWKEAA